ncbi:MAG: MBL fold metallo-hydrolase, partial [Gaiellales bacterium]
MDYGFDTIGNATVICYDEKPVLVTDPWVDGSPYFGSWAHAYEIPEEQREAILACRYVWFSHGHPDHLAAESLELFRSRQILLPDHVGRRMRDELTEAGFKVTVLPDRKWVTLSSRIRVLCIADESQNAVLLIDLGGRLLVNLNDCIDRGWGRFVRKVIRRYDDSVLLSLTGYGDADMINFWSEDGTFIVPPAAAKLPIGPIAAAKAESFGCKRFVPFSCMHVYQRSDSIWAQPYATPIEDHYIGFESETVEALPAFVRFFGDDGTYVPIMPKRAEARVVDPIAFGDDWSDSLERTDVLAVTDYFRSFHHLRTFLDFINVRVGGRDHVIEFRASKFDRGLTFEVIEAAEAFFTIV